MSKVDVLNIHTSLESVSITSTDCNIGNHLFEYLKSLNLSQKIKVSMRPLDNKNGLYASHLIEKTNTSDGLLLLIVKKFLYENDWVLETYEEGLCYLTFKKVIC